MDFHDSAMTSWEDAESTISRPQGYCHVGDDKPMSKGRILKKTTAQMTRPRIRAPISLHEDQKKTHSQSMKGPRILCKCSLASHSSRLFRQLDVKIREDTFADWTSSFNLEQEQEDSDGTEVNFWVRCNDISANLDDHRSSLIDCVVSGIQVGLHSVIVSAAGTTDNCTTAGSASLANGSSLAPLETVQSCGMKRKRLNPERDQLNSDGSESEDDLYPNSKPTKQDSQISRRFACPFFKNSPESYMSYRGCPGPGWISVHRLKEHLFRKHKLPKFKCNRCGRVFKGSLGLTEHQRSNEVCELRPVGLEEGIDENQEEQLKSRKKGTTNKTDHDKWVDVYRILFPGVDSSSIPSPYYNYATGENLGAIQIKHAPKCCHETLAAYGYYLEKELPLRIEQELRQDIRLDLGTANQDLKGLISEIVRSAQPEMLKHFQESSVPQEKPSVQQCPTSTQSLRRAKSNRNSPPNEKLFPLEEILPQSTNAWSPDLNFPDEQFQQLPLGPNGPCDELSQKDWSLFYDPLSQENLENKNARRRHICQFCPSRESVFPRADSLIRHIRVQHPERCRDDPSLREVITQRQPSNGAMPTVYPWISPSTPLPLVLHNGESSSPQNCPQTPTIFELLDPTASLNITESSILNQDSRVYGLDGSIPYNSSSLKPNQSNSIFQVPSSDTNWDCAFSTRNALDDELDNCLFPVFSEKDKIANIQGDDSLMEFGL
ncbi:hypothetical protein HD806DRAFT_500917 [Xylariaceae sp. AK1471]|nr:hypothetical protein HD806DRAFT_500917 [Xylariaceae sp. AK1471]